MSKRKNIGLIKFGKIISYAIPLCLLIIVFFTNRSLFLDSLNLARNTAEGSFSDFIQPLKYQQSAPVLFLFISKIITSLIGISEYSLRLFPLFSGIVCLFFFGNILNRITPWKYAALGILWLGTHTMFVRYSTEYKQYIVDALVTVVLLWLALKFDKLSNKRLYIIGIAGTISIWLSMPSIFILLGILLYFTYRQYKLKANLFPIGLLAIWLVINFVLEYFLVLKPAIQSNHMQNYHQNFFIQGNFWKLSSLKHDWGLIINTIRMVVGKSGLAIGMALVMISISIYDFCKNKKGYFILIVLPIISVFGASLLGKYSLIERLMLFTLPLFFILIINGVYISSKVLKNKKQWIKYLGVTFIVIAIMVGFAQTQGLKYAITPLELEDNRSSLFYINKHGDHSNTIICTQLAYPAYSYYTQYDHNYISELNLGNAIKSNYGDSIVKLAVNQCKQDNADIWILMGHMLEKEITTLISDLEQKGEIKNSYRTKSSAAILFSTQ